MGAVRVRYWAGAQAAAEVESDELPVGTDATVASVLAQAVEHRPRLGAVLPACSVLLDGRSVPRETPVPAGVVLEVLPPFAGG
ncbi:MoaD/ThiS family protein [Arsenicicoccus piscis]|uniref:Molybdopterin synthase sulfur carrier subunit n=1 Tax=Arsenicicoccus piscis TaxID=673954 RepID=A0ABQ6HRG2_9MICO|nr:MoaD/ThiS family protein [Arsenicicoccus piscis]MCH8627885.1 MoaD/ThiS family protein [Arsenicicoccus piscis]GMA20795.1 molybdopterin synthase sulfur carrier subunit [Arsenicicoccus piscis]